MTFLDRVLKSKPAEISARKAHRPLRELQARVDAAVRQPRRFEAALRAHGISVVAEIKPRSPSAGDLLRGRDPVQLALAYQRGGARALSVLGDQRHFGGGPDLVEAVASDRRVELPVLFKDFVVDPYQLWEARAAGAAAVLLIARAVDPRTLERFIEVGHELSLECLVECFTPEEVRVALDAGARILGVNNRDLQTFEVDLDVSARLILQMPSGTVAISESGLRSKRDVELVRDFGFSGVLVGEALLQSDDPERAVATLVAPRFLESMPSGPLFGPFGGRYVAETLTSPLEELAQCFEHSRTDPDFASEYARLLANYVGRPTPLTPAENLSRLAGGARIYLKREDLAHTGAHKINNALGQALLARSMGKHRIVAETGAGQHGVAVATACALLGLESVVYMGARDAERQRPNLDRMMLLGCEVKEVTQGSCTLKDAISEAIRDWIANVESTHYLLGSAIGPDPFPRIVRSFQEIIGRETRAQVIEAEGRLPDGVVACVGGGSNAIGIFSAFLAERSVALVGVQAGGRGLDSGAHAAPLLAGRVGILHGTRTYLLSDDDGQVLETQSIAAGLDYPAVGPEHSHLRDTGRVEYVAASDEEALQAFHALASHEGIIPALESAHAVSKALEIAQSMGGDQVLVVNLSGRGDKDVAVVVAREQPEATP